MKLIDAVAKFATSFLTCIASLHNALYISIYLANISLVSINQSSFVSINLSMYLSIYLFLSVYLSIFFSSLNLFIYVCIFLWE